MLSSSSSLSSIFIFIFIGLLRSGVESYSASTTFLSSTSIIAAQVSTYSYRKKVLVLNLSTPGTAPSIKLTDRQLQFWEDVEDGLDDIALFWEKKGQSIDRIRLFGQRYVSTCTIVTLSLTTLTNNLVN